MGTGISPWDTHDWFSRGLEFVSGQLLVHRICRICGRNFVDECSTGERCAVYVSTFILHRLSDEVTLDGFRRSAPANTWWQMRLICRPVCGADRSVLVSARWH